MSVSQFPVGKRFGVLLALAVLALIVLFGAASRASAESTVYNHPQTNVFFYYGTSSTADGYVNIVQIYKNGTFTNTSSPNYGGLSVHNGKINLSLPKSERIVEITTNYSLANGEQVGFVWSGKHNLPIRRYYGSSQATLVSVDVGVHSPKLPNQPPEPKYTGMH